MKEKSKQRIPLSFGVPAEHFSCWVAGEARAKPALPTGERDRRLPLDKHGASVNKTQSHRRRW